EIDDVINGHGIIDMPERYEFTSEIASLNEIYTLKVSHSPWVISERSWMKHIADIKKLKIHGAKLIPELHDIAYSEWEKRKGAKKVNLNQDKTEFFANNVRRKYDHDSIHSAIAFDKYPMYMSILEDNESVKTSQYKFKNLSEQEKVKLVQEEIMVLSLERDLIPSSKNIDKTILFASYIKQLRLLITQYSKGWFPQWIIENYYLVAKPPLDYWKKFETSNKKVLL
ncbi:DUF7275 domain-containing protein, partial [Enterococcus innesii]|uniref:DUF7275 domain-containing protein n=1 Tax=Enterococcus innesii TaxID=2839759 RepID=UPI003F8651B1